MGDILYWLSEEQMNEIYNLVSQDLQKLTYTTQLIGDPYLFSQELLRKIQQESIDNIKQIMKQLRGKGPDNDNRTSRNGAAQQQRSGLEESAGEGDRGPDRDIQAAGRNGKGTGPDHQQYRATILGNEPAVIANRAIAYRPDRRQRLYAERA